MVAGSDTGKNVSRQAQVVPVYHHHQQDRGPVPVATVPPQRNYGPGMMTTVIMHGPPGNRLLYPSDAFNRNKSPPRMWGVLGLKVVPINYCFLIHFENIYSTWDSISLLLPSMDMV